MESLQLGTEESKQSTSDSALKTHLTTIELLSNKPLTVTQIGEVFEVLNARMVPSQQVKRYKQKKLEEYMSKILPAEHKFPPYTNVFSTEGAFP